MITEPLTGHLQQPPKFSREHHVQHRGNTFSASVWSFLAALTIIRYLIQVYTSIPYPHCTTIFVGPGKFYYVSLRGPSFPGDFAAPRRNGRNAWDIPGRFVRQSDPSLGGKENILYCTHNLFTIHGKCGKPSQIHTYCTHWDGMHIHTYIYIDIYIYIYTYACTCLYVYITKFLHIVNPHIEISLIACSKSQFWETMPIIVHGTYACAYAVSKNQTRIFEITFTLNTINMIILDYSSWICRCVFFASMFFHHFHPWQRTCIVTRVSRGVDDPVTSRALPETVPSKEVANDAGMQSNGFRQITFWICNFKWFMYPISHFLTQHFTHIIHIYR